MKTLILLILSAATLALHAQPSNAEGNEVKAEFLKTYEGEFLDPKYNEQMVIGADGSLARLENRTTGDGTVCNYWWLGMITSVIERSPEARREFHSFQTHSIYVTFTYAKLNMSKTAPSAIPRCKAVVAEMLSFARSRIPVSFRYGAELFGPNQFRLHSAGGDDFKEGQPRKKDTLDEVFNRVDRAQPGPASPNEP